MDNFPILKSRDQFQNPTSELSLKSNLACSKKKTVPKNPESFNLFVTPNF